MLLKVGSTGEDVKKLQTKLGLTPDGTFGTGTEAKVKEFQASDGLTADGIVGDGTWSKMFPEAQPSVTNSELKLEKLKGVIPDSVLDELLLNYRKFNLTNNLRLAHFLSQCAHESGDFKILTENLNYSADGLKKIFPKYFPGDLNLQYAKNPKKIASRVYANRMGNGDENSGQGYLFRGRSYLQITGHDNYKSFSDFIGEDCVSNPDLLVTKYPVSGALFFFNNNKLWTICDKGSSEDVVKQITKRVNGGLIGYDDRLSKFNKYWNLLK